jgi:hypothetical protein
LQPSTVESNQSGYQSPKNSKKRLFHIIDAPTKNNPYQCAIGIIIGVAGLEPEPLSRP